MLLCMEVDGEAWLKYHTKAKNQDNVQQLIDLKSRVIQQSVEIILFYCLYK